jgi:Ger(x)C family germination protein
MRARHLIALALAMLPLAGCGVSAGIKPIDDRALVLGVAADKAGQDKIKYSLEIPSPQSLSGSSGGGNEFYTVQAEAPSFDAAISQMENKTSRDIYLGQMHVLILAADLPPLLRDRLIAEEQRIGETDHTEWFMLADGPAAKLLTPPPMQERLPAFYYSTHFNCQGCQAVDYGVPTWRVEADLASPSGVAVVPVAKPAGGNIDINRVAALRRGAPPFIFTPAETESVMALRGKLGKGAFDFPTPLGHASVRSMQAKVTRSAAVASDRRLHVRVTLNYEGLVAQRPERVLHMPPAALALVRQSCAEALTAQLTATIARAQKAGVDAFYFGQALYLANPEAYAALGDMSQALRHAVVEVQVHVKLPNQGIVV